MLGANPLAVLLATARQEEIFKSISDNVSQSDGINPRVVTAVVLTIAGVILLIALFNARGKRVASNKALNHPGKLLKEVVRQIPLRPVELKQLKLLARGEREAGKLMESPLVLLLCPSAFLAAARSKRVKVDRKAMASLARKLNLIHEPTRR